MYFFTTNKFSVNFFWLLIYSPFIRYYNSNQALILDSDTKTHNLRIKLSQRLFWNFLIKKSFFFSNFLNKAISIKSKFSHLTHLIGILTKRCINDLANKPFYKSSIYFFVPIMRKLVFFSFAFLWIWSGYDFLYYLPFIEWLGPWGT